MCVECLVLCTSYIIFDRFKIKSLILITQMRCLKTNWNRFYYIFCFCWWFIICCIWIQQMVPRKTQSVHQSLYFHVIFNFNNLQKLLNFEIEKKKEKSSQRKVVYFIHCTKVLSVKWSVTFNGKYVLNTWSKEKIKFPYKKSGYKDLIIYVEEELYKIYHFFVSKVVLRYANIVKGTIKWAWFIRF